MTETSTNFLLSVVLRTQLLRKDCLREAFDCLANQTDAHFELIVVLHSKFGFEELMSLISTLPESLQAKTKVVQVVGGKRGVPLNAGIQASAGTHIAFYDDDDLLTSDWVKEFHVASDAVPNHVLRSQVATLWCERVIDQNGKEQVLQISEPVADYASTFSHLDHLLVSHTPFMGLCYPMNLFRQRGLSVDEELFVCEDWDLLLQASNVTQITDIPAVTAFYRRWKGQESSYSLHSLDEWTLSETRVIEKLSSKTLHISGQEINRIRDLLILEQESHALRQATEEKKLMERSISWRITAPLRWVRGLIIKTNHEIGSN
jgi:glycosyltransferase involved in cell wall biosynthesis